MRHHRLPLLLIASLACAGGRVSEPALRTAAATRVLQGAAAVAANEAALRLSGDTVPPQCAAATGTIVAGRVIDDPDLHVRMRPAWVIQSGGPPPHG